ncbi:uncharacterized protein TRIADDRAFT_58846 [Trichoplax adhaerens]|uniref:G-protein coupled receptors family 1 profile domain-containing protein n=1 Tax=Trichoplax adhaerens TaxID=10228 RepID=B3S3U2_TRIAD|nr:hypothetical protein TRIADDRAFT_58846 [Trichoplax adhaerens]EDV22525.1 hypothetical protein TRIADDRAFT_58846 [Trichoplax adhaerens]|eukprot:XP_002115069.1 hypothetical protein TRIADDRAFT_58846 [Trichoplax adhaerens]
MSNTSNATIAPTINSNELINESIRQINTAKIALISLALILSATGVFIITFTIIKIKRLLNFTNVLVLNLCWSSLLLAITGLVNALSDINAGFQTWQFGDFACRFIKSMFFMVSVVIAYTLVAVSYARFRIICQPFRPPPERHYAYFVIAAVWIVGVACGIPYFLSLHVIQLRGSPFCSFNTVPPALNLDQRKGYLIGLTIVIFAIPFLLQAALNISIATAMSTGKPKIFIDPKDDKIAGVKRQLTLMSIALVIIFFVTWLPYYILILLQTFGHISLLQFQGDVVLYYQNVRIFLLIRDLLSGLIYCSSIFNVGILYIFNPHFKAALKRALYCSTPHRRARVESEVTITERSMSVVSSMMAGKIDMKY